MERQREREREREDKIQVSNDGGANWGIFSKLVNTSNHHNLPNPVNISNIRAPLF